MTPRACRIDGNSAALDAALLPDWHVIDTHAVGPRAIAGFPDRLLVWREDPRMVALAEYKQPKKGLTDDEAIWLSKYPGLYVIVSTPEECREFTESVREGLRHG